MELTLNAFRVAVFCPLFFWLTWNSLFFQGKKLPKRPSPFDKLPDTLILKIFSFLSSNELCVSARVCRRWYFLVWEPQLWTSVTLSGGRIQVDRGLKTLFRLLCRDSPTLCLTVERIHLNGCTKLTDKGLCTVALKCPELKVLELKGCVGVSSRGVTDIVSRCHNLERLDLTGKCGFILLTDYLFVWIDEWRVAISEL